MEKKYIEKFQVIIHDIYPNPTPKTKDQRPKNQMVKLDQSKSYLTMEVIRRGRYFFLLLYFLGPGLVEIQFSECTCAVQVF